MTDTTITQTPSTTSPAPTGTSHRRKGLAALAAGFAVAAIAGATALAAGTGAESTPADRPAPAVAGASMSADAAERAALVELGGRTDACRATVVAPDSLERCIGHLDG